MYKNIFTGKTCKIISIEEMNGKEVVFYRKTKPEYGYYKDDEGKIRESKKIRFTEFSKPKRIFDLVYKEI